MGGLNPFSSPSTPSRPPTPEVVVPDRESPEVEAAKERTRKAALLAEGRKGTLLTGGSGVTEDAPTKPNVLLSGRPRR